MQQLCLRHPSVLGRNQGFPYFPSSHAHWEISGTGEVSLLCQGPAHDLSGTVAFLSSHSTTPKTSQCHTCARSGEEVLLKSSLATSLSRLLPGFPHHGSSLFPCSWILLLCWIGALHLPPSCGAFWSHKRDTFKAGRVKPRCANLKSRFPLGETLPGSVKSRLCWGEDESLLRKWHYPGKYKKFPASAHLPLLATTCPKEGSTLGAEITPNSWTS